MQFNDFDEIDAFSKNPSKTMQRSILVTGRRLSRIIQFKSHSGISSNRSNPPLCRFVTPTRNGRLFRSRLFSSKGSFGSDDSSSSTRGIESRIASEKELNSPHSSPLQAAGTVELSEEDKKALLEESSSDPNLFTDVPGAQKGGKKLAILYTCKVCDTRSAKKFTENAYKNGVVMVRCPSCENLHLIADRLGFFEDRVDGGWDIEKFMREVRLDEE